jgi:tetraacyldisaccharide 4'-kinase
LLPFGYVYASVAWLRRRLFTILGLRKPARIFTIAVGNLTVGGTGKTPMTVFLANQLHKNTAILSRGYGRKTTGFREVAVSDKAVNCGDEPLEMKLALETAPVFVCENRHEGIRRLLETHSNIDLVILDDAFQHLPLMAHRYVLLCDYQNPFYKDFPMPAGRLREFRCTAKNTHALVVTKCPENMSTAEAEAMRKDLGKYQLPVFFSTYQNAEPKNMAGEAMTTHQPCMVVSGLARNDAFQQWARAHYSITHTLAYRDHQSYTESDFAHWEQLLKENPNLSILTTRKDFMRMQPVPVFLKNRIFITHTIPKFLFQEEDLFLRILLGKN